MECAPQVAALLERWLSEANDESARTLLRASRASYAWAWRRHFSREHDPSGILGERNVFRYRPCRRVLVRAEAPSTAGRLVLQQVLLAALTCGVPVTVNLARETSRPLVPEGANFALVTEGKAGLIARLQSAGGFERLRLLDPVSLNVKAAAHEMSTGVIDAPALATGRMELRWYLREQTVSQVVHRYGNVMAPLQARDRTRSQPRASCCSLPSSGYAAMPNGSPRNSRRTRRRPENSSATDTSRPRAWRLRQVDSRSG